MVQIDEKMTWLHTFLNNQENVSEPLIVLTLLSTIFHAGPLGAIRRCFRVIDHICEDWEGFKELIIQIENQKVSFKFMAFLSRVDGNDHADFKLEFDKIIFHCSICFQDLDLFLFGKCPRNWQILVTCWKTCAELKRSSSETTMTMEKNCWLMSIGSPKDGGKTSMRHVFVFLPAFCIFKNNGSSNIFQFLFRSFKRMIY